GGSRIPARRRVAGSGAAAAASCGGLGEPRRQPPPQEQPEQLERERVRIRRAHITAVRKLIMDYGRARRYDSQFHRCSRCDGRGVLPGVFGDRPPPPCPVCRRSKVRVSRKGILAARWFIYSPLYREQGRHIGQIDGMLRTAHTGWTRLKPFVQRVRIKEVDLHDLWARVTAIERRLDKPGGRTRSEELTYRLFRIGRNWYLWDRRSDGKVLDVVELEKQLAQPAADG
ncbi:MAG: hypothetical protein ACE5JG_04330, partial [Planctomycetota bacterium]